jgi:hypothetical protein
VKNRRSLTPMPEDKGGLHATRRGGARREVSARVTLVPCRAPGAGGTGGADAAGAPGGDAAGRTLEGWALNASRGGVRVILEEKVELGAEFEIAMVDGTALAEAPTIRVGRIVWVQEEPDGVVAGVEFCGDDGG